jgi:hypothetical protein
MVKGQLVVITYREENEDAWWEYGVVRNIYDERVEILRETGGSFMYVLEKDDNSILKNQPTKSKVKPLARDGKPVMSGRSIFGKLTFQPK